MTVIDPLAPGADRTKARERALERYRQAWLELDAARMGLGALIVTDVKEGMSEVEAARVYGLDRMTIRKHLGKR